MKNKKAFTLIELIAVLVILAILALIVTPLVLNIIRKAKIAVDRRSVDAYGRSIELAVADYLLDKGEFPTSIEQLAIEYTGDEVVCNTTILNEDSSVYLKDCTVGGREVLGYTYGKKTAEMYKSYNVGDIIEYKGINFYVINDSGKNDSSVTMLKAEPLTVEEVNTYGVGHINKYESAPWGDTSNQVRDRNGYGGIAYYTSEVCGYVSGSTITTGCSNIYNLSEIKYVIDAWAFDKLGKELEYTVRLLKYDELIENLEYEEQQVCSSGICNTIKVKSNHTPEWVYNSSYSYWMMTPYQDSEFYVWYVNPDGEPSDTYVYSDSNVIRPVIVISKSALN